MNIGRCRHGTEHHRRQVAHDLVEHVLADDGERHAGRARFFRAAVDHGVFETSSRRERCRTTCRRSGVQAARGPRGIRTVDRIIKVIYANNPDQRNHPKTLGNMVKFLSSDRNQHFNFAVTFRLLDLLPPQTPVFITGLLTQEVSGNQRNRRDPPSSGARSKSSRKTRSTLCSCLGCIFDDLVRRMGSRIEIVLSLIISYVFE